MRLSSTYNRKKYQNPLMCFCLSFHSAISCFFFLKSVEIGARTCWSFLVVFFLFFYLTEQITIIKVLLIMPFTSAFLNWGLHRTLPISRLNFPPHSTDYQNFASSKGAPYCYNIPVFKLLPLVSNVDIKWRRTVRN